MAAGYLEAGEVFIYNKRLSRLFLFTCYDIMLNFIRSLQGHQSHNLNKLG